MERKETWVRRTKKAFISATHEIIETEGIAKVTIRKVAVKAGYNSSSLYNYFENLDELLYMASIKYTQGYLERLTKRDEPETACKRYLENWRCFAEEALKQPSYYYRVFFTPYAVHLNSYLHTYYELFPESMTSDMKRLIPTLEKSHTYRRDIECLQDCAQEGMIEVSEIEHINDMAMLICLGVLSRVIDGTTVEENGILVEQFMNHIKKVLLCHKKS